MNRIMLSHATSFILICCITIFSASATQHRDGCKEFGDPCICSNTKHRGYCLPGWKSNTPDQLYCDCSSDSYTEDELMEIVVRRHAEGFGSIQRASNMKDTARILDDILKITGPNPTNILTNKKIKPYLEALKAAMRREKSLGRFIRTDDGCFYAGQECVCANTGRRGICAASRQYSDAETSLKCHCE